MTTPEEEREDLAAAAQYALIYGQSTTIAWLQVINQRVEQMAKWTLKALVGGYFNEVIEEFTALALQGQATLQAAVDAGRFETRGLFGWIWDQIKGALDWLWDLISASFATVSTWITASATWLWNGISRSFTLVGSWITASATWLWNTISGAFAAIGRAITASAQWLWSTISGAFAAVGKAIADSVKWLWDVISYGFETTGKAIADSMAWIGDKIVDTFGTVKGFITGTIFNAFGEFFTSLGNWFQTAWTFWLDFIRDDILWAIQQSLGWLWDRFAAFAKAPLDFVMDILGRHGRVSPEQAPGLAGLFYAFATATGLSSSAISDAGEITVVGTGISLKYISGFLGEISGWSRITAATIGVMTALAISTPFTYYVQSKLRPWLLSPRDFFQLMSRRAFTEPEALQNPALTRTMQVEAGGQGAAFEAQMIGYYGYPATYDGFFQELANTPLRYFPLAGIARTGFFEETWFTEALARSGYSKTAKDQLMMMYKVQAADAKLLPVRYQLRRLAKEHFITLEEAKARLAEAAALPSLEDARELALEWEREYEVKDLTLDIVSRAYTRNILSEGEFREELKKLGLPEKIAEMQVLRERLGLIRKVTIAAPPAMPVVVEVEAD